ncbi:MAG: SIR2 family protein [Gammaproteobacteria bacterium]|nr:SIR2 family protein [Gammaproteobacteria bacterium]
MKILLFAGAGTSVELGVPAMAGLATEFQAHCCHYDVQTALVKRILGGAGMDMEKLIEALDQLCGAAPALDVVGEDVNVLEAAKEARAEVEWFVQHSAERVRARDARLIWGSVIHAGTAHDLTVATTNYDRAIEMAAKAVKVKLRDGFGEFCELEFAPWKGILPDQTEGMGLLKLHGSTDWYAKKDSDGPVKLRHPVALYGRSELKLPSGQSLQAALILPSREKRITEKPYPRVSQAFLNVADQCELAVFVGSSLRDTHIKDVAQSTASSVPTFVVNPYGDSNIENAKRIRQHASTFLISTLPNALAGDTVNILNAAAQDSPSQAGGILDAIRTLSQPENEPLARLKAIERAYEMGVTLEARQVQYLLEDNDSDVARYALSLIYRSAQALELLGVAERSAHVQNDAYTADLSLLRRMLSDCTGPLSAENDVAM